ncbi:MAG: uncharacterized protein A8A55_3226 [Amphiamblys sp. WSBS2006]|nr:MAG: uncharacterized protein A8A55_3226 [Amphiamblys sp. WSBS2006]
MQRRGQQLCWETVFCCRAAASLGTLCFRRGECFSSLFWVPPSSLPLLQNKHVKLRLCMDTAHDSALLLQAQAGTPVYCSCMFSVSSEVYFQNRGPVDGWKEAGRRGGPGAIV